MLNRVVLLFTLAGCLDTSSLTSHYGVDAPDDADVLVDGITAQDAGGGDLSTSDSATVPHDMVAVEDGTAAADLVTIVDATALKDLTVLADESTLLDLVPPLPDLTCGVCVPGTHTSVTCDPCAQRTCGNDCQWGSCTIKPSSACLSTDTRSCSCPSCTGAHNNCVACQWESACRCPISNTCS